MFKQTDVTALQDFNYQPGKVKKLPDALRSILAANKTSADADEDDDDDSGDERVKNVMISVVYGNEWDDE